MRARGDSPPRSDLRQLAQPTARPCDHHGDRSTWQLHENGVVPPSRLEILARNRTPDRPLGDTIASRCGGAQTRIVGRFRAFVPDKHVHAPHHRALERSAVARDRRLEGARGHQRRDARDQSRAGRLSRLRARGCAARAVRGAVASVGRQKRNGHLAVAVCMWSGDRSIRSGTRRPRSRRST